ncbi:carbohydrate ABC transporter permease [Salsipaludibacter albus]|uniref:carbohydrate ABC transporter permease n=1 Tax=Salsipaludibacter albus TaxID=2849650 RepID=UPI001EE4965D|nr:sugar ABC transporter permease [Salsipaludibacter albus]MBY5164163.1 sugar ABC transporter permease [Salsipaludibacter albus]
MSATTETSTRPPRRRLSNTARNTIAGWGFSLPYLLVFLVFMAGPIFAALWFSFTDFELVNLVAPFSAPWAGFDNYVQAVQDPEVRKAAWNTAVFVVVGVPLSVFAGLMAAVLIENGISRLQSVFRVGYYLPVITSIIAIAVIWRFMLNPDIGLVNRTLALVGIDGPSWLNDPSTALPSIIVMAIWRNLGQSMIIFLAGLKGVPGVLYEASRVDGATFWQRFRWITLPQLRPVTLFALVITSIGYLQVFEEPFVMTQGGPLDSTVTIAMVIYEQGFNFFHLGYASAIAYMLFLFIAVLAFVQFKVLGQDD